MTRKNRNLGSTGQACFSFWSFIVFTSLALTLGSIGAAASWKAVLLLNIPNYAGKYPEALYASHASILAVCCLLIRFNPSRYPRRGNIGGTKWNLLLAYVWVFCIASSIELVNILCRLSEQQLWEISSQVLPDYPLIHLHVSFWFAVAYSLAAASFYIWYRTDESVFSKHQDEIQEAKRTLRRSRKTASKRG